MQWNILNQIFKTPSHLEHMILSFSMYEKTYLQGFLEGVLEAIQLSSFYWYAHGLRMVGSPLQSSSPREKEKKGHNTHKAYMGTLICGRSPPIYRHLVYGFFIKTLIIMSISTNIHRSYVCDPLGPYISLVNNSIEQITLYWLILIKYRCQHKD